MKQLLETFSPEKMAAVDVMFVSSAERAELLRGLVVEKLSTAAREILAVVDRTVAGLEEEASGLRQVIDRQRRQLELLLQPHVTLFRIGATRLHSKIC